MVVPKVNSTILIRISINLSAPVIHKSVYSRCYTKNMSYDMVSCNLILFASLCVFELELFVYTLKRLKALEVRVLPICGGGCDIRGTYGSIFCMHAPADVHVSGY